MSNERTKPIEFKPNMTFAEKKDFLVNAFLQARDLNVFLDYLAMILGLPVLLITPSYSVIACSGIHAVTDDVWNYTITAGHYPDFVISYIVKNYMKTDISYKNRELFERSPPFSMSKCLLCNLWHQGEYIGAIITLVTGEPPNEDNREIILIARDLLQKTLALGQRKTIERGASQEILLIEIINGKNRSHGTPYDQNLLESMDGLEHFLLINVDFEQSKESEDLPGLLHILFPKAIVFFYGDRLLILLTQQTPIEMSDEFLSTFEDLLSKHNAIACISDEYDDLYRTREHYCKNVRVCKLADIAKDTKRIIYYSEYRFIDMYLLATSSISKFEVDTFVCKKAYEIYKYDMKHKTEYISTLWSYLNAKESVNSAAKMMYVHKNTITYRLSRIKDLFNLDLSNFEDKFQMYYSCCILNFHINIQHYGDTGLAKLDWDYGS